MPFLKVQPLHNPGIGLLRKGPPLIGKYVPFAFISLIIRRFLNF